MRMELHPKILGLSDLELILDYEQAELQKTVSDDMEREMAGWHAPWRKEALEHYLPLGWSFGLFETPNENPIFHGYFLAQPQLFVRGLTQSLWLEHMNFDSDESGRQLLDVAYRFSREKHLQSLLMPKGKWQNLLPDNAKVSNWEQNYVQVKTAKF